MKNLNLSFQSFFRNWPLVVMFLVTLVFFSPVWLKDKVPLPVDALVGAHIPWSEIKWVGYPTGIPIKNQEITDSISQFYPWRALAGDFWRSGRAPLWNQYIFSGAPFLATLHSAALYPLNFVYLFLNNTAAWTALVVLQIFLSMLFMYFFLRELNLAKLASVLGGIVFAFSGYMIAWLEFATGGHAGLWLPLLLLFELRLIKTRNLKWLLAIAISFFFIYTAGDFQVPLYISIVYILFGLYALVVNRQLSFKEIFRLFLGFFFGILISLIQLLPTIELFLNSIRYDDPYIREYYFGILHWGKIVNFIWPDFFGNVVTGNYWGKFGYHEYLGFTGAVSLAFASFSLFSKKKKYENFFWLILFISLLFLFPTPFAFLPFNLKIPALGTSSASRLLFVFGFCMSVLAAHGFSKLSKSSLNKVLRIVFYWLVISLAVVVGLVISLYVFRGLAESQIVTNLKVALKNMIPSSLVFVAVGFTLIIKRIRFFGKLATILIFLMAVFELLRFGWKNTPFSPKQFVFPKTEIINFFQKQEEPFRIAGGIPLNLSMPYKISTAEGYDPIYPRANALWFSLVNFENEHSPSRRYGIIHNFGSSLIDYANVKYVVDYKKNILGEISDKGDFAAAILSERFDPVFSEGRVFVFKNRNFLPKIWLTINYRILNGTQVFVEPETQKKELEYLVSDYSQSFNQINFKVKTPDRSLLFLSESHYPGWKAYVDGRETKIYRAHYLFQAVEILPGEHNVRFIYEPLSYKIGESVSLFSFLILLVSYGKASKKSVKTSSKRSS